MNRQKTMMAAPPAEKPRFPGAFRLVLRLGRCLRLAGLEVFAGRIGSIGGDGPGGVLHLGRAREGLAEIRPKGLGVDAELLSEGLGRDGIGHGAPFGLTPYAGIRVGGVSFMPTSSHTWRPTSIDFPLRKCLGIVKGHHERTFSLCLLATRTSVRFPRGQRGIGSETTPPATPPKVRCQNWNRRSTSAARLAVFFGAIQSHVWGNASWWATPIGHV